MQQTVPYRGHSPPPHVAQKIFTVVINTMFLDYFISVTSSDSVTTQWEQTVRVNVTIPNIIVLWLFESCHVFVRCCTQLELLERFYTLWLAYCFRARTAVLTVRFGCWMNQKTAVRGPMWIKFGIPMQTSVTQSSTRQLGWIQRNKWRLQFTAWVAALSCYISRSAMPSKNGRPWPIREPKPLNRFWLNLLWLTMSGPHPTWQLWWG